jgi:hypothetical protein
VDEFRDFVSKGWKEKEGKEIPLEVNSWQIFFDELTEPPLLVKIIFKPNSFQ